jgi:hypothetical protein
MLQNSQISEFSTTDFFGSRTLPGMIIESGFLTTSLRYCKTFNDLFFQLSQLQVNLLCLLAKHLIPSCFYQCCWVQCSSFQQLLLFFTPPKQVKMLGIFFSVSSVILTNSKKKKFENIRQIFSIKILKTKTGYVGI